jgi:hypothetical protein
MSQPYPDQSDRPSYSEANRTSDSMNIHLPLILLSLAASVFFGSQIGAAYQGKSMMTWQGTNADNQIANVEKAEAQLAELIKQREDLVKQATQIQTEYTNLLNAVIDLAETDEDARNVVAKWKIQRSKPAAGTADPSTTGSSSPGTETSPPAGGASGTPPSVP